MLIKDKVSQVMPILFQNNDLTESQLLRYQFAYDVE